MNINPPKPYHPRPIQHILELIVYWTTNQYWWIADSWCFLILLLKLQPVIAFLPNTTMPSFSSRTLMVVWPHRVTYCQLL
jgi:hypothetical protein